MKSLKNKSGILQAAKNIFNGPFTAVIVGSEKQEDKFIYSILGMGGNEREEIEVFAGAPIIEWLARGTEVLVVPHLFSKSELFIIARAHSSALLGELSEEGDFAIERDDGTYARFKAGEITLEAATILLGKNATESAVLGDILTTFINSQKAWNDAHIHSGVIPGVGSSGPPTGPSPVVTNFKSDVVKIK